MPIEPTDRAEPMQGLAEWLRDRAAEREADAMHKVFPHHANILRRWADEVEASRQRPAAKFGCHCDLENTVSGQPDECVFDNGDIEDCVYATELQRQKKGKADCKYWQPIKFATPERPAAQAASAEPIWISVSERMPEPETDCLVWSHPSWSKHPFASVDRWGEQHEAPVAWSSATIPIGLGWDSSNFDDVTHWMPLPAAPDATPTGERPAAPAQAPWKAISDAIRKVTGHPDLTSGSLSLLGEIIRALAQASPASDAWRCACGSALYIDAEGKPRSKAADGVQSTPESAEDLQKWLADPANYRNAGVPERVTAADPQGNEGGDE
jgi:hypothetical protein